jgi:hypothetical protein
LCPDFQWRDKVEAPVALKRGKDACKVVEKDGDDSVVIALAAPEGDVPG